VLVVAFETTVHVSLTRPVVEAK